MNLDKYKAQHEAIALSIHQLRAFAHKGIAEHAADIARLVIRMSSVIKLHLSTEDRFLYPALQEANDRELARMGQRYQEEMTHIAEAYGAFSRKWNSAEQIAHNPEGFRIEANRVLKTLFERMKREEHDFYPAVETA